MAFRRNAVALDCDGAADLIPPIGSMFQVTLSSHFWGAGLMSAFGYSGHWTPTPKRVSPTQTDQCFVNACTPRKADHVEKRDPRSADNKHRKHGA